MLRLGSKTRSEKGYILLSIMLLVTLMLLTLTIEAPRIAQEIKREKEQELINRGNQYKVAIRKYFRKFGRYPMTIEALENTNNMRFLRKRYKDPFTGKDDWRLLHPGEVQINLTATPANTPGQPGGQTISNTGQLGNLFGQSTSFGGNPPAQGQQQPGINQNPNPTTPGATPAANISTNPANTSGFMSASSGNTQQFGGGPIVGVASISKKESIKERDGKNHYDEWPFVYDPRQELQALAPGAPGANNPNPAGTVVPGGQINPAGPQMSPPGGQMNLNPPSPPPGPPH